MALAAIHSKAVVLFLLIIFVDSLFIVAPVVCGGSVFFSLFCYASIGTYMRVTVNKGIDKCLFTLSQAMNFD